MGIEKAELKVTLAKDFGRQYATMARAWDREIDQISGEQNGYKKIHQSLKNIYAKVDEDLDAGAYEGLTPLEVAKAVKLAITRVGGSVDSLAEQSRANKFKALGRIDGILKASEVVEKVATSEQKKIESLVASLESGEGRPVDVSARPAGRRPEPSVAAQRRAEGKKGGSPESVPPAVTSASPKGVEPLPLGEVLSQKGIRTSTKGGAPRVMKSGGGPKKKTAKKASKKTTTRKK